MERALWGNYKEVLHF